MSEKLFDEAVQPFDDDVIFNAIVLYALFSLLGEFENEKYANQKRYIEARNRTQRRDW